MCCPLGHVGIVTLKRRSSDTASSSSRIAPVHPVLMARDVQVHMEKTEEKIKC
jgi:hypothetical protein